MSYFIKLQGFNFYPSQLNIKFLNISENSIIQTQNNTQLFTLNQSLIYITLNQVSLRYLFISKEKGLSIIIFQEIFNLSIQYIQVSQHQIMKQQCLHQKFDCFLQNSTNPLKILNFYFIDLLTISDMNITNNQYVNSIIYYVSKNIEVTKQKELIRFIRIYAYQNVIILGKSDNRIGIITISTYQQSQIHIFDSILTLNIMQEYEGNWESQALIINIQAKQSSVSIQNTKFENNLVLNSYESITYIQSQNITIQNCSYFKNNLIQYEILHPFMFWDFEEGQNIFFEDILTIFQIKSYSGNGVFEFNNLVMENISIQESRAFQAAGFKFIPSGQNDIFISEFQFQFIETTHSNSFSDCGVMIFDLSNSVNLFLRIKNVSAQKIFLYNKCSFINIYNSQKNVDIILQNVQTTDFFSQSGGLLNLTFQNDFIHRQSISISNINYETSSAGWEDFTNNILAQSLLQQEITEIQQESYINRTVFFINFGTLIQFQNMSISGLIQESVFFLMNIQKLVMNNIIIQNLIINDNLIFVSLLKSQSTQFNYLFNIFIRNLKVRNITQLIFKSECKIYKMKKYKLQCSQKLVQAPQIINKLEINVQDYCKFWKENLTISDSIIKFVEISKQNQIYINNLELSLINCFDCSNGAIFLQFVDIENSNKLKLQINNFIVLQSQCGKLSCIFIQKINSSKISEKQVEQYWPKIFQENEIIIQNYNCIDNKGLNGTCLNVNNLKIALKNCIFKNNKASFAGGALYFSNNNNFIFIDNCYISENYAVFGGGIFLLNQFEINYSQLHTFVKNNKAFQLGQNVYSAPLKLSFQYGGYEKNCYIDNIYLTENQILDQVLVQKDKKIFGIETNYLLFPNGQQINKYQYFDWQNRKYEFLNLNFRIIALTYQDEKQIDLDNSSCIIKSGLVNNNTNVSNIIYTNNYTNFNKVYFSSETEDYNLDNLEIYFSSDQDILQIEFQCDSISIPLFNKNYPCNLINSHQNYSLRFLIKPLSCQLGEIKNIIKRTCDTCNGEDGFFSLQLNSQSCQVKDDVSTIQVTSATLQLRQEFWRPYFDTSIINYCQNLPQNCLGGWVEGDQSCLVGHIGALCEQCDLVNIRGDGKYNRTGTYRCSLCKDSANNIFILILLSIYIFISIQLSVSSNIQSIEQQLKILKLKLLGFRVIQLVNEKSILLKMLNNYFQIIGTIYNVQKNVQIENNSLFTFAISPFQSITVPFDCLISNNFKINVHYPFSFAVMVFLFQAIRSICISYQQNIQLLASTTLLYIYIYFQPTLVGKLVQLISFRKISGFKWILVNVAYRYDNSNHYLWIQWLFIPVLLILTLGIPFFLFYSLYSNKKQLNNQVVRRKWGYLFGEYRQEAYLWEVLKIIKKSILLGFLNYYEDYPIIQVVIVLLVLLVYLQFSIFIKPYSYQKLRNLDQNLVTVCLISVSTILIVRNFQSNYIIGIFQKYFFMLINFRFLSQIQSYLISCYFKEISKNFEEKLDKIRDYIRNNFLFLNQIPSINKIIQNQNLKKQRRVIRIEKLKLYLMKKAKLRLEQQKDSVQPIKCVGLILDSQQLKLFNQSKQEVEK